MAVALISLDGGRRIDLDKTIILVGRNPDCDLILTSSKKISRKHCCIAQVDNRLVVRDLGSMNGVWINGERIHGFNDLKIGDEISFGDLPYRLERVEGDQKSNGSKREQQQDAKPMSQPVAQPIVKSPLPLDLSQDVPIAIADQPESFVVEPSINAPLESFPLDESLPPTEGDSDDSIDRIPLTDSDAS